MEEIVFEAFSRALPHFFEREIRNILDDVSERNLCGLLQVYLRQEISGTEIAVYHVDTEYNRKQQGQVKTIIDNDYKIITISCDLLVHSRGEEVEHDNLLALEMKKSKRPAKLKQDDKNRLIALTRRPMEDLWGWNGTHPEHVCGYKVGIYMEVNSVMRVCYLERYRLGQLVDAWTVRF
ncbi:hypothetical protein ACFFGT_04180 [Mucilaginibacter angelicae]|uniref:PD-(D/E)XK nuclease superfamily protein n=1 Tax=Mucilaginibacter angelicae TaxID=869718 RepID=A0ABV6L0X6_9SPHI